MRNSSDPLSYFRALEDKPFSFDFFQALRRIECLHPDKPRLGEGLRPVDEPLRLAQEPSMAFAPSTLSACNPPEEGKPGRIEVKFFGLLGPNGPLPLHLTEYARARLMNAGDAAFVRFLDMFTHRFLLFFYRSWAQGRATVSLDRPRDDRFTVYVGALEGIAGGKLRERDDIGEFAKLFFAGLLGRQVRNRDGLVALLASYFRVPVQVEQFAGHWMSLPPRERTRLFPGEPSAQLGSGTVLGARVWDAQHKFRVWLGPLTLGQYESFLPGGKAIGRLVSWIRQYLCFEFEWDARLVLQRDEVPKVHLGQFGRLGWTTWLGTRPDTTDAIDLTLDAERLILRQREAINGPHTMTRSG